MLGASAPPVQRAAEPGRATAPAAFPVVRRIAVIPAPPAADGSAPVRPTADARPARTTGETPGADRTTAVRPRAVGRTLTT
ncbi:hypothetical protein SIN09_38190, partial [Streptomyces sp. F8]|nr:hypothetical protein [Streptomyces sp. F8]